MFLVSCKCEGCNYHLFLHWVSDQVSVPCMVFGTRAMHWLQKCFVASSTRDVSQGEV